MVEDHNTDFFLRTAIPNTPSDVKTKLKSVFRQRGNATVATGRQLHRNSSLYQTPFTGANFTVFIREEIKSSRLSRGSTRQESIGGELHHSQGHAKIKAKIHCRVPSHLNGLPTSQQMAILIQRDEGSGDNKTQPLS
ncbi:hypothetical protein AL350_gp31 [Equine adenovirus 2]|uniref:Uncharacterized protein n=1 Tax=Equine adenovirus B serotype 2 TaxID=67603 RepID=A0A0K1DCT0_ADEE2|nr:hypothetical protein AL350_gp31 [Equine adenovirus 2]AKT26044.1 hypothetical protein [Equine adenovirus 2]